jgi:hypothetical protein
MPTTHTRIVPVFGLLLAFTVAATLTMSAQEPRPQQPGAPPSAQQPPAQPPSAQQPAPRQQQAQIARGELSSVDATAKSLTIKPADGAEQKFTYNDATKVTGDRAGIAGLATLSGKQVVVHYNMQGANRVATEIEVQADKK